MKYFVCSDLHLEFRQKKLAQHIVKTLPDCDGIILAGDIVTFKRIDYLRFLLDRYDHVIYVTGNHEYYGTTPKKLHNVLNAFKYHYPGFHWLNARSCQIDGTSFVGGTLWFQYSEDIMDHRFYFSDFSEIKDFEPWVYNVNRYTMGYLKQNITKNTVVITHHLPTYKSVAPEFENNSSNIFYVTNMEPVIEKKKPMLWIHGHSHSPTDYVMGKTWVVSNPLGYYGVDRFDLDKIVDL